jgi:multiple sugar transport system substrate-binding protein
MKRSFVIFGAFAMLTVSMPVWAGGKSGAGASGERVVTTTCEASYAGEQWYREMNAAFTKETGIRVDVQPTPGNGADHLNKVNTDLLAGGTIDVIPTLGYRDWLGRYDNGFFAPLNDLAREAGIDEKAIWGKYVDYKDGGAFYAFPYKQEIWCVYYNKDMFDKAGVPYPSGSWTWDDYIATAKKLTDTSKGLYGSFMQPDNPWYILHAMQQTIPFYKPDGTCNFDDPAWAQALQWYYDLSHKNKIQPSVSELLADNASWNYYALVDNMAMFTQGNWFTRLLNSQADYPRSWKYGVAPLPRFGRNGNKNFVSMAYTSVNKNAAHPKEAVVYAAWLARNQWRYEGGIPALASLTPEQQNNVFEATASASGGQIAVADLYRSLMDNGMDITQSDIIGPAASECNQIIREEAERFNLDQQDLAATVRNTVARCNEAIANSK